MKSEELSRISNAVRAMLKEEFGEDIGIEKSSDCVSFIVAHIREAEGPQPVISAELAIAAARGGGGRIGGEVTTKAVKNKKSQIILTAVEESEVALLDLRVPLLPRKTA